MSFRCPTRNPGSDFKCLNFYIFKFVLLRPPPRPCWVIVCRGKIVWRSLRGCLCACRDRLEKLCENKKTPGDLLSMRPEFDEMFPASIALSNFNCLREEVLRPLWQRLTLEQPGRETVVFPKRRSAIRRDEYFDSYNDALFCCIPQARERGNGGA